MSNFRAVDRGTAYLLPPPRQLRPGSPVHSPTHIGRAGPITWRFAVEIVEQLDLSTLTGEYRGSDSAAYHPQMLAALLLHWYATGTYSSCAAHKHNDIPFAVAAVH